MIKISNSAASYGHLRSRFTWVGAADNQNMMILADLDKRMSEYYSAGVLTEDYHDRAEDENRGWQQNPLFAPILNNLRANDHVVEFGCGTGYKGVGFKARGCRYTGLDLIVNRRSHPAARDCVIGASVYQAPIRTGCADLAVSFYCLEHCVYPHRMLNEMIRVVKYGGFVALAFPEILFNSAWNAIGSMRFGWSPGSVRQKLSDRRYLDAGVSWLERKLLYRFHIARARRSFERARSPRFLVNPNPLCLTTRYTSDNDAVYFASEAEVSRYLTAKGLEVVLRSEGIVGADRDNALVLARKHN